MRSQPAGGIGCYDFPSPAFIKPNHDLEREVPEAAGTDDAIVQFCVRSILVLIHKVRGRQRFCYLAKLSTQFRVARLDMLAPSLF